MLISHDGAIKVCDFGIAKAHNRKSEDTQSGVLKGKFSYMSPEQCQSKPIDRRSDVFSIGILLYELTTLSKLFRGTERLRAAPADRRGADPAAVVARAELSARARARS